MKTRVVRYWHQLGWLYKVEKWALASDQPGQAGYWDWHHVEGAFGNEDAARHVAWFIATHPEPQPSTVVVEYALHDKPHPWSTTP